MAQGNVTPDPVRFNVETKSNADADDVKRLLEAMSDRIAIHVMTFKVLKINPYISGETDQATYEQVFGAELRYETRTIPNLNRGPYQVQEWVEIRPAKVPDTLKGKVMAITLVRPVYLTD